GGGGGRRHRRLLFLLRHGPRLRPDEHDLGLAAVGRVPGVVVEKLPVLVDEPANAGRARRLAALDDQSAALNQGRVRLALDRRLPGIAQRPRLPHPPPPPPPPPAP